MAERPDIHRLIELQKLLAQFRGVKRVVPYPGNPPERESDTEHSFNLAIAAWYLAPHFPEIDRDRAIRFALMHDMVEVHAGDTFAFVDGAALTDKKEREHAALQRLAADWADFPDMCKTIEEYERKDTSEAQFVYALDKIMPAILNYLSGGIAWREHGITFEKFQAEKERKIPADSPIYPYYEEICALLRDHLDLFAR